MGKLNLNFSQKHQKNHKMSVNPQDPSQQSEVTRRKSRNKNSLTA